MVLRYGRFSEKEGAQESSIFKNSRSVQHNIPVAQEYWIALTISADATLIISSRTVLVVEYGSD
jgi:hypothetical protein